MQMKDLTPEERELVEKHRQKNKKKRWEPVDVGLIDVANKRNAFDSLYALACDIWARHGTDEEDEDDEHWCYEAVMELLDTEREDNEPTIWDRINGRV